MEEFGKEDQDYIDLFSTFENDDVQTTYLYKKQDDSKKYAWIATFDENTPDFTIIAKKYGAGCYRATIIKKKNELGKKERFDRAFMIDEYHKKNSEKSDKSDISEIVNQILNSIIPLINNNGTKRNDILENSKLVESIFMNQIKGYTGILREIKNNNTQDQFIAQQQEYDDEDNESDQGDMMEAIFQQLESYLPSIMGKTAQQVRDIVSNPIVKTTLKLTFGNYLKNESFADTIKNWLNSKLGAEITNVIIQTIFK